MKGGLKVWRKIVAIIFIIAMLPIIFCGCWNYREIDTLAIVAGMAIDKDIKTNKYILTTEIITTQTQGTSSNMSSEFYSAEGDGIFSAARNMIGKTGLKLFWSDAKVIIISEAVAKEGVIPATEWVNRAHEIRADIWIMIAQGNTAAEILKAKVKLNGVNSFHLDDAMKSGEILSKYSDSRLVSFIDGISSEGNCQAVATIKNELMDGTKTPRLEGSAIFKADKLVGYLDGDETLYLKMIKNKIKEGLITIKNVLNSDTNVTLEIYGNRTKSTPFYNNGRVSLIIDIYPVVGIEEVQGSKDFMDGENLKLFQSESEKEIAVQIQYLISKLQKEYDCDALGFGEIFAREKPKVSENFKKNGEDIFLAINTTINVHLQITRSGKTIKPIGIEK